MSRSLDKEATPKARVLRRHPTAMAWQSPSGKWWISLGNWAGRDIGRGGLTATLAWKSAANGFRK